MVKSVGVDTEMLSASLAEAEPQGLAIHEALRQYCDPALVAAFDAAVAEDAKFKAGVVWLGPIHFDRKRTAESRVIKDRKLAQVAANLRDTQFALEKNLRRQLERDRLHMVGDQIRPVRKSGAVVPNAFASLCQFILEDDAVEIGDKRYIDVRVLRGPPPEAVLAEAEGSVTAMPGNSPIAAVCQLGTAKEPRPRGREGYERYTEEAMRARWSDIQEKIEGSWDGKPNFTQMAAMLHTWLKQQHPDRSKAGELPTKGTLRKHAPKVYRSLLAEASAR
jgi:hypothetical protein